MSDNPRLWWAVDQESGGFVPLPAGPMLIPAIIIYGILRLFKGRRFKRYRPEELLPRRTLDGVAYRQDSARFKYLTHKKIQEGLSDHEEHEYNQLHYPVWANRQQWPYDV